jgi:hypothetical protein
VAFKRQTCDVVALLLLSQATLEGVRVG